MKVILYYLALLNLLDGAVTYLGLQHNMITEANPLMDAIYEAGPHWFLILKVALSVILYGLNFTGAVPDGKGIRKLAMFAVILYTGVCVLHSLWIIPFVL
ncbi:MULTISPECIES: DUF5658 family protein [Bacillaceae]|uniref:DUF5658 domain-containing protein n=1 Tax=Bacillus mesophilum TaxID=1071718 RepID=A0A7V7RKU0_9BACI|nr:MULTISPECIES: DUF5658 family protein [Bacillaceae]KAB2331922.1 hypothetical protein F7732_14755 [Bacillus mesophilum]